MDVEDVVAVKHKGDPHIEIGIQIEIEIQPNHRKKPKPVSDQISDSMPKSTITQSQFYICEMCALSSSEQT